MKDTERHNYIGDHIRKLREEKGWTQQVLGKKLGKKTSTISAYETNAKLPSVDCLIEMAELFDVSLDTLVYGDRSNLISIRALRPEQKELISSLRKFFRQGTQPLNKGLACSARLLATYRNNLEFPFCGPFDFSCPGLAAGAVCFTRVL